MPESNLSSSFIWKRQGTKTPPTPATSGSVKIYYKMNALQSDAYCLLPWLPLDVSMGHKMYSSGCIGRASASSFGRDVYHPLTTHPLHQPFAIPPPPTEQGPRQPGSDITTPLWTEWLTHASENITLPQTSFNDSNKRWFPQMFAMFLTLSTKLLAPLLKLMWRSLANFDLRKVEKCHISV